MCRWVCNTLQADPFLTVHMLCTEQRDKRASARRVGLYAQLFSLNDPSVFQFLSTMKELVELTTTEKAEICRTFVTVLMAYVRLFNSRSQKVKK